MLKRLLLTQHQAGAGPGRFKYADINGDEYINADDRTFIGSPFLTSPVDLNFTLKYANFDFVAYFYASLGNEIFNQSKWFTDFYPSFQGAAISERVKGSWSPDNLGADDPGISKARLTSARTSNQTLSTLKTDLTCVCKTLRWAILCLQHTLSKLKMTKLRIFVSTNNVATITGYDGLDPSVGGAVDTQFGIDVGNAPLDKSFTFGINLGF